MRGGEGRSIALVMAALMTCLLLAALDQTIVSTALPTIVGELGGIDHISWVVTAYLLSSTASVPLFGKISDVYGRKPMLQLTIVVFLAGSVLAGMSQSMLMLILTRGLQGVGGGGLMAMTFTILGDILPPRERSKYTGYFTAVFASSSVLGPLIGGFFVDHLSWRWVFYVNLPLGAVAMLVVAAYLRVPAPTERRPVDVLGALFLTAGVTTAMLVAVWGGKDYAWDSGTIIGLSVATVVCLALYLRQARVAPDPILPLRMFREPVFRVCVPLGMLLGAVMVGGAVFLPLFLQVVQGVSATSSGFLLVPMMGGMVVGSNVTGRIVNRTGRYKVFPIVGSGISVAGMLLLTQLDTTSSRTFVSTGMAILGLGVGTCMPVTTLAVQNTVTSADMGTATSAVNFFRSLGSAFGVAVFGTVMNSRLDDTIGRMLPGVDLTSETGLLDSPARIRALPPEQLAAVVQGLTDGIVLVFQVAMPLVIAAFVLSWFLRELPLRDTLDVAAAPLEGMAEAMGESTVEDADPDQGAGVGQGTVGAGTDAVGAAGGGEAVDDGSPASTMPAHGRLQPS